MSKILLGRTESDQSAENAAENLRCLRTGLYLKNAMLWEASQNGRTFLGELQKITRMDSEKGYIAYLKNAEGAEDFATFSDLGGDKRPSDEFSLLITASQIQDCSFLLKNENDIYLSKPNLNPEFIGVFQALEQTEMGTILIVQKDDKELLYDCETGCLVFSPMKNEMHWVNSTGCIARNFPWHGTGEKVAEVYVRGQFGFYECRGRIPVR